MGFEEGLENHTEKRAGGNCFFPGGSLEELNRPETVPRIGSCPESPLIEKSYVEVGRKGELLQSYSNRYCRKGQRAGGSEYLNYRIQSPLNSACTTICGSKKSRESE